MWETITQLIGLICDWRVRLALMIFFVFTGLVVYILMTLLADFFMAPLGPPLEPR